MTYFDTDVVIHSIIVQDQLKHNQAIDLIRQAIENEAFFISFLVLHETAFVLSKLRFSSEFISENIKSFSTFASFHYSESIFSRARLLAEKSDFRTLMIVYIQP